MLAWCFNNKFRAPPSNFTAPAKLTNCTYKLDQWCSSKPIASDCGVSNFIVAYPIVSCLLQIFQNFIDNFYPIDILTVLGYNKDTSQFF